jgi:hypothetical protein
MTEKKVVSRNIAVGLGVICIALAAGLAWDRANYISIINSKDVEYQNYILTHGHSDGEYDSLQSTYASYLAGQHHTDAEYDALLSQYKALKEPKLVGTLNAEDVRPELETPSLHIYGNIVNVGKDDAGMPVLCVEAFQGPDLVFNTSIGVGYIFGRSFAYYVDQRISYVGRPLTTWRIWSQPPGIDWSWTT